MENIEEKLKKYQSPTYADFLKEKCVLDAQQFLRSGLRSFRDALIIRKWFESICDKSGDNEVKLFWAASTEIAGHYYDDKEILNILTFDWIFRITNGLDCLLQYINAALNFGIETNKVDKKSVLDKLNNESFIRLTKKVTGLFDDENIKYIFSYCNFRKHIGSLIGHQTFKMSDGSNSFVIPGFLYKDDFMEEKDFACVIGLYEKILEKYVRILDEVDSKLRSRAAQKNRWHFTAICLGEHIIGEPGEKDLTLNISMKEKEPSKVEKCWIDDPSIDLLNEPELIWCDESGRPQRTFLNKIYLKNKIGEDIGYLELDKKYKRNSVYTYCRYKYRARFL